MLSTLTFIKLMKSTPLFKVFSVTYPILRRIEVTLMINNFIISVTS